MSLPKPGDRIRMIHMPDDPSPIPPGTTGTVQSLVPGIYEGTTQIGVKWDINRSLFLIVPPDKFEIIGGAA